MTGACYLSRAWFALASVPLALAACADPEAVYNRFIDDYQEIYGADAAVEGDAGMCPIVQQADLNPNGYLFALSSKLAPTKPIVGLAQLTREDVGGQPAMSFHIQPLAFADQRTPQGEPIVGGPFEVRSDGSFTADFGQINVVGEANPISQRRLETTATLQGAPGSLCAPIELICGGVEGIVTYPLNDYPLAGSNFAMVPITDPANYPKPVLNCDGAVQP